MYRGRDGDGSGGAGAGDIGGINGRVLYVLVIGIFVLFIFLLE